MSNVLNNLKQVWQQASLTHRAMLIAIVMAFLVVTAVLVNWAAKPELALLYSGLAPEDAAKIEEKLRDEDIPFKLKDGGTTILVPEGKVHSLRLTMVRNGLPTGGNQGYSILDNGQLGQSPFKERINYIRAIEGELTKTIKLIEGVTSVRVHVVNEQHSIFTRGRKEASATVVLKTRGGQLPGENVSAITNLVAGAVKSVSPDKVVVVANGQLLAGRQKDKASAMSGELFEYKMKMETYYAEKAEDMLARVFGRADRATVKVDVKLTSTTTQSVKRTLDPKDRFEKKTITKKKNKSVPAAGKAKGRSNASPGATESDKTEEIEYEGSYATVQTSEGPGRIESVAVAVFVDLSASQPPAAEGEQQANQSTPATPAGKKLTAKDIEDAVRNALGLKSTDQCKVVDVPFQQVAGLDADPVEKPGIMSTVLKYSKDFSLGMLVLGMLIALKIVRGKKPATAEAATETPVGEAGQASGGDGGGGASVGQMRGPDRQLRTKITNALNNNPDQVKQLFLSWVESSGGD